MLAQTTADRAEPTQRQRSESAAGFEVWVRACAACERLDPWAAFGNPDHVDDWPWQCRRCACSAFVLVPVLLP